LSVWFPKSQSQQTGPSNQPRGGSRRGD